MAKRVNKPFVITIACVAGALGLGLAGVYYFMSHRHNTDYWVQKGEAALADGKLLEARNYFGAAVTKQPSNPDLYMKIADVDERLVTQDRSFLDHARMVWATAVQIDPTYKPAMDKLMDLYLEQVRGGGTSPELYTELRRNAEMMARVDPADVRAQIWAHAGTIQQWLNGAAFTNKAIDDDVAALEQVAKKHPESADAAFYISVAQLRRARNFVADGQPEKASELFDQIAARHEESIKSQPKNGSVQIRAYQVFATLMDQDRRADKADRYKADVAAAIQAAKAGLQPDDQLFDDAQHYYALWLRSQARDRKEVEKAYRDWVAARPSDAQARLELADYLSADLQTRPEALKILAAPVPIDPNARGLVALRGRMYERAALLALDNLRVDDLRTMTGPDQRARRDELLAQVDADLAKIAGYGFSEDYGYLRLRGKVEMLHARVVDAMKTFERARTMSGGRFDLDLWMRLADAYLRTGQTGSAQRLLEEIAGRVPTYAPARIMLAELYLTQHESDRASGQIQKLQELASGNAQLAAEASRLRAALLADQKQGTQAKLEVSKLPEATKPQRLLKGELSAESGDNAEAIRLFQLVLNENPGDLEAVGELINLHMRDNHRELAQQVVADALKTKPSDPALAMLRDGLNATTPEAIRKYQDQVAEQIVDPLTKAIRKAGLSLNRGEYDAAKQQLDAADKIRPDDGRTVELRYQWYLRQNRLADAASLVDRVAKAALDGQGGYAWRTRYALDRRDNDGALTNARALVGAYGEFASAHILLGRAQQGFGQYNDAVRSYDAALDRQPGNLEAMRNKAECLELMGRFDEEKMVVDAAVRAAPDNPLARDLSLNFELSHGDPLKVVETCESLVQKEPDNPTYSLALGQACTMAAQGKLRTDRAQADKYLARANEVLAAGMTRFVDRPQVQQFYGPRAQAMLLAGDLQGAEKLLMQFVALPEQKDRPEGYRQLAMLYEQANRPDLAEKAWRTAYDNSAKSIDSELELARFYNRFGHADDALKVLEANAASPRVMTQRIDVLLSAGRTDQAQALVDQMVAKNGTDLTARFYRGVIELRKGDAAAAERDFSLFRDKDPQNVNGRLWLARALRARDNVAGAIAELEAALKVSPTRSDVRMALLDNYSYGQAPLWDAFDRTVADAKADPRLSNDPVWSQISARGLAKRGQFDRALAEIQEARKADPKSYALGQDYVNILLESKKYKQVLEETDKSLADGHKEGLIFEQRGVAKSSLGDKPGALQEFDAALAIAAAQHDADGVSNLLKTLKQFVGVDEALARLNQCPAGQAHDLLAIQFHLEKGDFAATIRDADSLLAQPTLSAQNRRIAVRTKAEAYYVLKQYENSRKAFDELLSIQPDDWLVLNNVAYLVAEDLKQPLEARKYSGRAYQLVQRTGGNATVADTHGWVLTLCQGHDAVEGMSILEKLASSPGVFPKARYHLAEAYLRQNRTDNALNQLTLAKAQIQEMEKNHQPVENELKTTVQQALDGLEKKKSQASSR